MWSSYKYWWSNLKFMTIFVSYSNNKKEFFSCKRWFLKLFNNIVSKLINFPYGNLFFSLSLLKRTLKWTLRTLPEMNETNQTRIEIQYLSFWKQIWLVLAYISLRIVSGNSRCECSSERLQSSTITHVILPCKITPLKYVRFHQLNFQMEFTLSIVNLNCIHSFRFFN